MGKKRKRQTYQYDNDDDYQYYSEQQPVEKDAHAYSSKSELPWDIEPYDHGHGLCVISY